MKRIIVMLLAVIAAVVMLTSCKKEAVVNPNDYGQTMIRVREVSTDGSAQYSTTIVTYVKY